MSKFTGFSEEDLKRIKSSETDSNSAPQIDTTNYKKIDKIGAKLKRNINQYKLPVLQKQDSDKNIDNLFDKCKLSIKTPTSLEDTMSNDNNMNEDINQNEVNSSNNEEEEVPMPTEEAIRKNSNTEVETRKNSSTVAPDLLKYVDNYTEDELAAHRVKLGELQLKQKLMEEQNKKRKEMLAKALADRTKQTEEEVLKLEKIKKELQVLDGQFSHDVAMLRKKIDQACLCYADAEKHYLKVEKEFLQAKINLQKEREKKELLTEHLCALITHNETRKAQKLETLMLELASDKKVDVNNVTITDEDDRPYIVDGVDVRTGPVQNRSVSYLPVRVVKGD